MFETLVKPESISRLHDLIERSRKIVITCHISPDGDAMGSSLGLYRVLRNMGKLPRVVTPDTPPKYLSFLPGAQDIVAFSRFDYFAKKLFAEADLIFCLDYNEPKRIDLVAEWMMKSPAPKVMIDHHINPDPFPVLTISHPEISSTSALACRVLHELGLSDLIDREAAECFYTGMMTDTGNFSYNSNDPVLYEIIADLLRRGIDKDELYKKVYFVDTINSIRLNAYALSDKMEFFPEHHAALITLTREELNRHHYQKGDTEGLVNKPLTCPDVVYSIFLREETDYIKVSMRSKGSFKVNIICANHFNGGGHENAAGGEFFGTMQECIDEFKRIMPLYDCQLPE